MRALKAFTKYILVLLLVVAALVVVVAATARTDMFGGYVLDYINKTAVKSNASVDIPGFSFDLFDLSVSGANLKISSADKKWQLESGPFKLKFLLLDSLGGEAEFDLDVQKPVLKGSLDTLADKGAAAGKAPSPVPWRLRKVRVVDGRVEVSWPSKELALVLTGINVDWLERFGKGGVTAGHLIWKGEREELLNATFEGERTRTVTSLSPFALRTTRLAMTGGLKIGLFDRLGGDFDLRLDLRDLPRSWLEAAHLGDYSPVGGTVALDGQFGGSLAEPVLKADLEVGDGRFGPLKIKALAGGVELLANRMELYKVSLETDAGNARDVSGVITFGASLGVNASATFSDYNLRKSMGVLGFNHFPVGFTGSGKISAKGRISPGVDLQCRVSGLNASNFDVTTEHEGALSTWYAFDKATAEINARVLPDSVKFSDCVIDAGSVAVEISRGEVVYAHGLEYETEVTIRDLSTVKKYLPEGFDARGTAVGKFGGPYNALKFNYKIDLEEGRVYGTDLGRISLDGDYDLHTLLVQRLSVDGPLGEAEATGSAVLARDGEFSLDVKAASAPVPALVRFISSVGEFEAPVELDGTLSAEGRLAGPIVSPEFRGNVEIEDFSVGPVSWFKGIETPVLKAEGNFGLKKWRADAFTAQVHGAAVSGSLAADLQRFSAQGGVAGFNISNLAKIIEQPADIRGVYTGSFKVDGPYADLATTLKGKVQEFAYDGFSFREVEAGASLTTKAITLSGTLPNRAANALVTWIPGGDFNLSLELSRFPWELVPAKYLPQDLSAKFISGKGTMEGVLGGKDGSSVKKGRWEGTADELTLKGRPIGKTDFKAEYPANEPSAVRLEAAVWQGEAKIYTLFSSSGKFSATLGVDLNKLDLKRLAQVEPSIEGGQVDMHATLTLRHMPPEAKDVKGMLREIQALTGRISARDVKLKNFKKISSMDFEASAKDGKWSFRGDAPPFATVDGTLDDSDFSWRMSTTLLNFDPVDYFQDFAGKFAVMLNGRAKISGRGASVLGFSGEGDFSGLKAFEVGPHEGEWKFTSLAKPDGEAGDAVFSLTSRKGVTVEGRWLAADKSLSAKVAAKDASLGEWTPPILREKGIGGKFTGTSDLAISQEGEVSASAALTGLSLDIKSVKLSNRGDILLSYKKGKVFLDTAELKGDAFDVSFKGSAKPGENFNIRFQAGLDLSPFAKRIPHVERLSGRGEANGTLSGTWDKPRLEGVFDVRDGAELKVDKLAYAFKKLSAHWEFEAPGEVRIEKINADFGEGTVHAEGRVGLKEFMPDALDIFVLARDIRYEYPHGYSYVFDGDFMITGTLERPEVRGEAHIQNFIQTTQIKWRTATLAMLERAKAAKVGTKETGDVYIDIAVQGDRNIRIENNIANLDLTADLRVKGYLPTPELWGRVDATGGTVRFRGREFTVLRSNVEFLGDAGPVAVLDGRAVANVGEYAINVSATGPLEDVKIELSSVPPLSRTDIVSLLALGTTSEHLEKSEALTAFEATNLLTGSIQDELEGQAYNIFGIDQFHINPSYSATRQTTVPRITVGKALGHSLYARYGAELGAGTGQDVSLEYLFRPGIVVLGSWADEGSETSGSFGAQVRFRFSFR